MSFSTGDKGYSSPMGKIHSFWSVSIGSTQWYSEAKREDVYIVLNSLAQV
jgi:hypothetical protein